ncbi:Phosphoethanolamine transferase CptA [uncultured Bacteroides sp.]|uniref:phosphoethanolamine transferase n=1 Tax=Bacteroides cellulolyticus TaxID=2981780 RepID=UPI000820ACD3|nr:phosphoethanolamine transferase [Bacteroides cellulolyticus]MCU6771241.1 sulfatase-like hydrolase/transferase [Bacteroides cellulolyticus]SCH69672.1 Phosphoethanolamine transferase CptA [uncultured Bacteroides sp.]
MDKIGRSLEKIFTFLCKPFTEYISFFITVFFMSSIVDFIGYTQLVSFPKAIFIALHHYFICYILTIILLVLPKYIRCFYKIFVYSLLAINLLIDSVCVFKFHFVFNSDVFGIILGTNKEEVYEFIKTYISIDFILVVLLVFIFFYTLYNILLKVKIVINTKVNIILLSVVFISILSFIFVSSKNFGIVSVTKLYTILNVDVPPNLKDYYVNPSLKIIKKHKPKNIIMIIGESFSKSHSSLYGYEKNTNPRLSILENNSELYVFSNVKSSGLYTIEAFQGLMSTYKQEYKDSIKWYKCLTIQEILRRNDYNQIWISNQSKTGLYDNVVTKYSELCDTVVFVGDCYSGSFKWTRNDYDELLLEPIEKYNHKSNSKNNFYFIHLMGSHHEFNKRYPQSFDVFKEQDYLNEKEHKRKKIAEYDNSVLYNDYIVNEIIKIFKKEEALIFYFSDHALDIFESREDYIGHARHNDIKSVEAGSNIPFILYVSPKYQANFPDDCERIKKAVNKKFRTDDMIYTIMDVIGVEFEDNNDVERYSLFNDF